MVATAATLDLDPATIARAEHIDLPQRRTGVRRFALPLPADQSRQRGARWRAAAAAGPQPRRADRPRLATRCNLQIQFWTSRGFAVVDVDYGGSTGYGRAYRSLLDGHWGILDVEDCIAAARHLAERGQADPAGWRSAAAAPAATPRSARSRSTTCFRPAPPTTASATSRRSPRDTHKFESRYLDRLVGPWPEAAEIYRERSPIHHASGCRAR